MSNRSGGLWFVEQANGRVRIVSRRGDLPPTCVAEMGAESLETALADARLMREAPVAIELLKQMCELVCGPPSPRRAVRVLSTARAVVAKAEGHDRRGCTASAEVADNT